ncbi:MAG TPA: trypsin-like serine protease [Polyangia bacterium]|nr:trypsin-like serine protease [Polyangia bacterium]
MGPGLVEEDIIGGTTDTTDSAVVLLYMTVPGQTGGSLCTAEVISPHVVVTAAHCTGGEDPAITNAVWRVYLGPDFSKATAADMLVVTEAHYNAQFDIKNLPGGNDVGVAILQNALPSTIVPLPVNHASMDTGFDGKQVRFVGYGLDDAAAQTGAGVKRTTTTTLSDHTALLLHFADATHETCNGDSGGPALMTLDGRETIVGLTSYGDVNCSTGGYDTRVDAMAAWIDGYVQKADPGFSTTGGNQPPSSSTPPSPSGGTQSPPTSSATPMPPSSTGAGGVGASCGSDNDCQSHLCGLGDNGTHVCFPADANQVHGGMGCSIADDRARGGGDATPAALALVLLLIAKLARARRRARRYSCTTIR